MKRQGTIKLTYDALRTLLDLNEDHQVIGVYAGQAEFEDNTVLIKVQGSSCPLIREGDYIPWVAPHNGKVRVL